jgi:homoserine dehydrogenase
MRIGVIGLGTVGAQVTDRLLTCREALRRRSGTDLVLDRVLVRDVGRPRAVRVPAELLTTDPAAVIDDPGVDVVVELAGGEEPARSFVERAIRNGKHVVTANKLVMAQHGPELLKLANQVGVDIHFEAAVGGGVPIVGILRSDLDANVVLSIQAIVNGTTNYVLGRMADQGSTLREALAEAREAGYAEADPTDDICGRDAACKLAIMASLAFRTTVRPQHVHREGIECLQPADLTRAREQGYEVKLLASASRRADGGIAAAVRPALVPRGHPLARVEGAGNAILVEGDLVGPLLLQGMGAGGRPTASSVVHDILDVARAGCRSRESLGTPDPEREARHVPLDEIRARGWVHCRLADRSAALADVRAALAAERVGIVESARIRDGEPGAEFVLTTGETSEAALGRIRRRLSELGPDAGVSVLPIYR